MPLTAKKNQYLGINAHANSWLQNAHKWRSFHANHITDLTRALNGVLLPEYVAVTEESLQIDATSHDGNAPDQSGSFPRPDVTIFDQSFGGYSKAPTIIDPIGIVTPTVETMKADK